MLSLAKEEKMRILTDSQSMMLSKAAAREDGVAVAPRGMNKAAAAKVGSSLVARKLMREMRSKPGMSIWREENGRNVNLVITRVGRHAIGVENDTAESDRSAAKETSVAARLALAPSKLCKCSPRITAHRSIRWSERPAGCPIRPGLR
jgi:hypothetical protein